MKPLSTTAQHRGCSLPPWLFFQFLFSAIVGLSTRNSVTGFSVTSFAGSHSPSSLLQTRSLESRLCANRGDDDDDRELVRVPRRGGRRYMDDEFDYDDESRSSGRRNSVQEAADALEDDGYFDDLDYDDDEFDDDEFDGGGGGMFGDVIPNKYLDSVDPDGATERFGELASDPKFWFDIFIATCLIGFLEFVGSFNSLEVNDIVSTMQQAGLPPPGVPVVPPLPLIQSIPPINPPI